MFKQEIMYISNIFNMAAYETKYDKIFTTRNEIINYQILIFTLYKGHQKITKYIINVFEVERKEIKNKINKGMVNNIFCTDIVKIILSYLYK